MRNRARGKIREWGGRNKFIARLFSVTKLIETILTGIGGLVKIIKQHTKDPEYKAQRKPTPSDLKEQMPKIYDMVEKM